MNLVAIRSTLAEIGANPLRSLGQNFLHDQNAAQAIVEALDLSPEDHLIEIGAGLGALTEYALPRCGSATLVEKDAKFAARLQRVYASERVEVLHEDATQYDYRQLFIHPSLKVLGNLPYYVTSPILFALAEQPSPARRMVFTVQREFADRLSAEHDSRVYGAPTVLIGVNWKVRMIRKLPPTVFYPAPEIESAVIELTPVSEGTYPWCDYPTLRRIVKDGFAQRRKMLSKVLPFSAEEWTAVAGRLGVPVGARPEHLSIRQWVALTRELVPEPTTGAQDIHGEIFSVVNAQDEVVGSATRHEVHEGGLVHRAIHGFILNYKGELFLQKRSRWKDKCPGLWDSSCAGHVDHGASYDETAIRELREELGVEAPLRLVARIPASEETGNEFVHLYEGEHEGPFKLPPAEIETGGFFPIPLIDTWTQRRPEDFAPGFLTCYRHWREAANSK